jgi:hypothetical protein
MTIRLGFLDRFETLENHIMKRRTNGRGAPVSR